MRIAARTVHSTRASFTMEINAGARRPDTKVYMASSANATASGQAPGSPITRNTASMPMSCSAMYGIVARMPVTAMASPSVREPKRARTNSAGVTNPCT
jgi:hypothetical protein